MICAKPVINTQLPTGVPWVSLHGETGLTVPPGDPAALAEALRQVLDNHELRERLGAKARERALELFTLERYGRESQKLYDELLRSVT